jgi:uncharacterized membrane protein YdjX (TVP38/TMEM64 family)
VKRGAVKVLLLAVLAGGAIVLYFSPLRAQLSREHIHELIDRLRVLWYAPALLIALYAIGSVFAIPASSSTFTAPRFTCSSAPRR